MIPTALSKITPAHLRRPAYVYVRQATRSASHDGPSALHLQYALCKRATELGWRSEQLVVIDCDIGSAATARARPGFDTLLSNLERGRVGLVLCTDVSRLTRTLAQWRQMLHVCRRTSTLVLIGEELYDPAGVGDSVVLGLPAVIRQSETRDHRSGRHPDLEASQATVLAGQGGGR